MKEYLRSQYKQLKEAYKYYSTIGVVDEVWSIGLNIFTDFINSCSIIDNKNLNLSDADRKFIGTNAAGLDLRSKYNPDK